MALKNEQSMRPLVFSVVGSVLLVVMAFFHGSGFQFIREAIIQSNTKPFIKDIFPVLFLHPSVHLLGLAAFGVLAIFLKTEAWKVWIMISLLILVDAFLAMHLGAIIPAILLVISAACFLGASRALTSLASTTPDR